MTYGPPDPNASNPGTPQPPAAPTWQQPAAPQPAAPQPAAPLGAAPQQPFAPQPAAVPQGFAPQAPPPPQSYPAQPYGAPQAMGRAPGPALGVFSLILGVLGLVVPFLPFDMSGGRGYLALPFGLLGLGLGIAGCFGFRRGKAAAIVGLVLSALALALGMIMLGHLFLYTG